MTIFEQLKESNAWSAAYQLPNMPMHSNPWIYTAYAHRIFWNHFGPADIRDFNSSLRLYFAKCEPVPGYISKWPGDTNPTSHDELLGAAYLSKEFASRSVAFLASRNGNYGCMTILNLLDDLDELTEAVALRDGLLERAKDESGLGDE